MNNQAQSEAPSVDDQLHEITRELFLAGVRQGAQEALTGKSDPAGPEAIKAKAKINRLIEQAQIKGEISYPDQILALLEKEIREAEIDYNKLSSLIVDKMMNYPIEQLKDNKGSE